MHPEGGAAQAVAWAVVEFVLTPEQMGAADRAAIEAGTPVDVLMDRAGWALARAARDLLGSTYARRVTIVCGKGNNGGDGLVAARRLRQWGVRCEVFTLDPALDRSGLERALGRSHLAVDAMFGTGFRGTLEGDAAFVAEAFAASGLPVLACDIPSGVNGLTGEVEGPAIRADHTVTFAAAKPGLLLHPGRSHVGTLDVAPIGVDPTTAPGPEAYVLEDADVGLLLPGRSPDAHKWDAALLVVAGSPGMLGAADMVARSAMRAGAGMVVLAVPGEEAARQVAGGEVVTRPLPATADGHLDEPAAKTALEWLERFDALVVGPGLGTHEPTVTAVRRLVAEAPVPVLADADGLNALAGDLAPLRERPAGQAVLTPHAGEFARLAGASVEADRLGHVRRLAADTGAVVLLKGTTTLVAAPDGTAVFNVTGGPWLATAGTGDVLSGVIGGLLAVGLEPTEATAVGAFLHGRAADHAGHRGLVAGDLVTALPDAFASLTGGVLA